MSKWFFINLMLLTSATLSAMLVGNPAEPRLMSSSIIRKNPSWWSFRLGYLDDWVYRERFEDEFKLNGVTQNQTFMKLSTYAAILNLNFKDRIDFYGLVGSSRLQLDKEIFTKRALGWGVGTKLILFRQGNFFLGGDAKYFETSQKPRYFVVEGSPYNIVSNYRLKYHEIQGALGVSYRAWMFAPYANATYLLSKMEPEPALVSVRLPEEPEIVDIESKSIIGSKKWGMALGLTLVDSKRATLSCEWRAFNQNAVNVNGELRF
jgi:hypothetical protein